MSDVRIREAHEEDVPGIRAIFEAIHGQDPEVSLSISEAHTLAHVAMRNRGLSCDVVADEHATSYPDGAEFELKELTAQGLPALLRIERGRLRNREVFGPVRLQCGFFKLTARQATCLIARDDRAVRALLKALCARCRDDWETEYVEVDVGAHAPRLQHTLVEMGFVPMAYVPAMVFHEGERLDVIEMALQRPDIAMVLHRNLAVGLGRKLQRLNAALVEAP